MIRKGKPPLSNSTHNCAACMAMHQGPHAALRLHELAAHDGISHKRSLSKRQFLFQDGDMPEGIYSVSSGSFKLFKSDADGDEHIIGLALPGSLLGLRALISDEPYSVSAMAREASNVCFFEATRFRQFLAKNPEAAKAAFAQLGRQLREAREELFERSAAPAPARLAHCLLNLEQQFAPFGPKIQVSGQELASMIGVAPETISRQLNDLVRAGLITHQGKEIRIRDKKALSESAEGMGNSEDQEDEKKGPASRPILRRLQEKAAKGDPAPRPLKDTDKGVKTPLFYS